MKHEPRWRSEALNVVAAAVIALLVWAYANDRTRETATLAGTVRLSPADPRATWVAPSAAVTVSVELRGSRRSIERAETALRAGLPLSPGADGLVRLPDGPGLGMEIDPQAVRRYQVDVEIRVGGRTVHASPAW